MYSFLLDNGIPLVHICNVIHLLFRAENLINILRTNQDTLTLSAMKKKKKQTKNVIEGSLFKLLSPGVGLSNNGGGGGSSFNQGISTMFRKMFRNLLKSKWPEKM